MFLEALKSAKEWDHYRNLTKNNPIIIEKINFNNDDLTDYDFQYCYFKYCTFEKTTLHGTNFRNSIAYKCSFKDAKFWHTCFEGFDARSCLFTDIPINCWMENTILSPSQIRLLKRYLDKFKEEPRQEFTEEYADGLYKKIWNDPANF